MSQTERARWNSDPPLPAPTRHLRDPAPTATNPGASLGAFLSITPNPIAHTKALSILTQYMCRRSPRSCLHGHPSRCQ